MNIIVVDDFYQNPDAVRALALNADYRDVTKLNYPGFQSVNSYSSTKIIDKIAGILGCELEVDSEKHTFGKFRIMLKEGGSQLKVHLDGHADWTGVLYLSNPNSFSGGTGFYRHKKTGLEGPVSPERLKDFSYSDWQHLEKDLIEKDTLNPEAWEETAFVGMKFNRLVLFQGNKIFHCHTESFGTNKIDGRMTQNFFFNEA